MPQIQAVKAFADSAGGKQLLEYAIAHYTDAEYVTLSTATKSYKAILHFYIDEIGFTFWTRGYSKK